MTNEQRTWEYLKSKGINDFGVAGLMGNLQAESGLIPNNLQNSFNKKFSMTDEQYTDAINNGSYKKFADDGAGYGIAQWTSSGRKEKLLDFALKKGCRIDDLDMQLEYLYSELEGNYKGVLNAIKNAQSIREASDVVLTKYERPKDQNEEVKQKRALYGLGIYSRNVSDGNKLSVDKVIKLALAEEGYLEKSAAAYKADPTVLDRKTDGAGSDNYTKYGRDMHAIYPSVMDFPGKWCDCYVDWCFYMAYGITTAKSLLGGDFNDYTVASAKMYLAKGALDVFPEKGAQVFFTKNGRIDGIYHTGIVYNVDDTDFFTSEGNTSSKKEVESNGGCVALKKYNILEYAGRVFFGHPKYDDVPVSRVSTKVEGAESFDKDIAGSYTVSAVGFLNIRCGAGLNKPSLGSLKSGTVVHNYGYYTDRDGKRWLYVKAGSIVGYCSAQYLTKK